MKGLSICGLLALLGGQAIAQTAAPVFTSTCTQEGWSGNRQKGFCETRDLTLPAPSAGQVLTIDGGQLGGIVVSGWDGPDIRVRARVQCQNGAVAAAQQQVQAVHLRSADNVLQADIPGGGANVSVNYEVFVPRQTALALRTTNGGISLAGTRGPVTFAAASGGITLTDLGGDVRGTTRNGGVTVTLTGRQWVGPGLDVKTTNGGITWRIPAAYSAHFKTGTRNGGLAADYPLLVPEKEAHSLDTNLGAGGALVSVLTNNGGITIKERDTEGLKRL